MQQRTNSLYSNKIKHNLIYLTQQDLRKDKVTSVLSVIVFFNLTLCKITTLIMKIKMSLILFFLSALVNNADAQIRGVLIDVETRQPIDGVAIYTNTNKKFFSDKNGHFFISDPNATSLTLTHNSYVRRNMEIKNIKDSTFLIPKAITINTVVITAKAPRIGFSTSKIVSDLFNDPLTTPKGPSGIDLLSIFEKSRSKVRKSVMRRAHEAVKKY